jgi:hypothetical protein
MFYMHFEDIRSFGDLAYWIHTHAFVVPIAACLIMGCLIASSSLRRS